MIGKVFAVQDHQRRDKMTVTKRQMKDERIHIGLVHRQRDEMTVICHQIYINLKRKKMKTGQTQQKKLMCQSQSIDV